MKFFFDILINDKISRLCLLASFAKLTDASANRFCFNSGNLENFSIIKVEVDSFQKVKFETKSIFLVQYFLKSEQKIHISWSLHSLVFFLKIRSFLCFCIIYFVLDVNLYFF